MSQGKPSKLVQIVERPVPELSLVLHENPLAHRLLAARGVEDPTECDCSLADLPRPEGLPDIDKAVSRLLLARDKNERILIVGDYDCDGATSTCVALSGLAMLGFRDVAYLIPSRFEYGYGLSPPIVDLASQEYAADLIITVDNGVASVEGVTRAAELGIDVVVTDHHLAPEVLPDAHAIVNPNVPGSTFSSANLAGVGVIFYTLLAIRSTLLLQEDPLGRAPLAQLLDLVAIGTVADVVPLDRVNRILVEQGLRRIRAGQTRPGVLALILESGRSPESISTQDIGFGIGPRLNAAGRLDDMRIGVLCLMSSSDTEAKQLAGMLNEFNQQRRAIEQEMRASAETQLETLDVSGLAGTAAFSVCLFEESWHQGVIGILAGRIKENLHLPVVIFTRDDNQMIKGSARSIPGVHIRDALQAVAARHPDMINKFGGHAMAAGLTIPEQQFEAFKQAFEEAIKQAVDGHHLEREFLTDGCLPESERCLANAQLIEGLMPWGQGFEAPLFADNFVVEAHRIVGKGHLKLSLKAQEASAAVIDAIAFNCAAEVAIGEALHIVYSLEVNTWRDRQSLQLRVQHLEHAGLR